MGNCGQREQCLQSVKNFSKRWIMKAQVKTSPWDFLFKMFTGQLLTFQKRDKGTHP